MAGNGALYWSGLGWDRGAHARTRSGGGESGIDVGILPRLHFAVRGAATLFF